MLKMSELAQQKNFEILFSACFAVDSHGIKKNNKEIRRNWKTGKNYIGSSDRSIIAQKKIIDQLFKIKFDKRLQTINCRINAQIIFYYPESKYFTKKNERSSKVGDISNLYQIVEDSLQKAQIISNDSNIESHDGSRRRPIKGERHYLQIVLTEQKEPIESVCLYS